MARAIAIEAVTKVFRSDRGEEVSALEPVTVTIGDGEFFSLIGPSGCGKTTLLRMISGLLAPSSGRVRIGDRVVREPDRQVSIVFQKPTLLPWRTVMENCLLPIEIMRPRELAAGRSRAAELLQLTGLDGFRDRYPSELSGGMQQRAAIVRALISEPDILLMDEPFSALDEFTREKLNEELLRLRAVSRKTIVFVTHNIGEAVFLSDRVGVMAPRPGRLGTVLDMSGLPAQRDNELRKSAAFFQKVAEARAAFDALLE